MPKLRDRIARLLLANTPSPVEKPSEDDKAAQEAGSYVSPWFGKVDMRIGTYNRDRIPQSTYDLMECDPIIALALEIRTLALVGIDWSVNGPNPRVNKYIQAVLEPIMPTIIRNCAHRGAARGCAPVELVWESAPSVISYMPTSGRPATSTAPSPVTVNMADEIPGSAEDQPATDRGPGTPTIKPSEITETVTGYRIAKFKPLSLTQVYEILMDGNENFAGFRCVTPNVDLRVEEGSCFLFTHNPWPSLSPFYGQGDFRRVYDAWYRKQFLDDCYLNYLQRFATPTTIVTYPEGATADGTNNKDVADSIALQLTKGGAATCTLPAALSDEPQWSVDFKEPQNARKLYDDALNFYNQQMLRGMLIGDKMVTSVGAVGSYALSQTHFDVFILAVQGLLAEILNSINKQLVPLIVRYTFGPDEPSPMVESPGVSDHNREVLEQLLVPALRSGSMHIDVSSVADRLGLPIVSATERPMRSNVVVNQPTNPSQGTQPMNAEEQARAALVQLAEAAQALRLTLAGETDALD